MTILARYPLRCHISSLNERIVKGTGVEYTHSPNLSIMPINNWMHAHELRPVFVRRVEVRQELAMGVCPPGPHKDRLDRGPIT